MTKKIYFLVFLNLFIFQKSFSQCFEIESILVDACDSGTTPTDEGYNEMVRFKVGTSAINTSTLNVNWPSNSWLGLIQNATTASNVAALNAQITAAGGCGQLIQPVGSVLPANAQVILVTSYKLNIALNYFGAITQNIYIIFQNNATTNSGHFGNYNVTPALRTLVINFGACSDTVTYQRASLVNTSGTTGGTSAQNNGATVNFTPSGTATYTNNGCVAPVNVFTVDAGNNTLNACAGETISLLGTAFGQQSVLWTAPSGTFSTPNALSTNYTLSATASGTVILTLTATNTCLKTKSSTITVNVKPSTIPTFSALAPICSGDPAPVLPPTSSNGITGSWSPAVNNTASGTYTFTPDPGQCAASTTLDVVVNTTCAFGSYASAVWITNCATSDFYNTVGAGTSLIGPAANTFTNNYFGTFIQNSSALKLRGAEIKTFKSASSNVCSASLNYRVYAQSATPGTFTVLNLPFFENCGAGTFPSGGPCTPGDQKWQRVLTDAQSPVDLTAYPPGNYVVEVFYDVTGDLSSTTLCRDTILIDNNGVNFKATFTIQSTPTYTFTNPTTCNGTNGSITIFGLAPNTTYSLTYLFGATTVGPTDFLSDALGQIVINGLGIGSYSNFALTANSCTDTNPAIITLSNPVITPTFTAVAAICSGDLLDPLPTTSDNGITGSWSPALSNTASDVYTFMPDNGQCATTTTLSITVNAKVTPTFTAVAPICSGTALAALPLISNNGITGSWSPALSNTASDVYTFMPDNGQCATSTTLSITVNAKVTPTFTAVSPICNGSLPIPLPTTSNNGITGSWSPALSTTASNTYTFTPSGGQCAIATTLAVTVLDAFDFEITGGCLDNKFVLQVASLAGTFDVNNASYNWQDNATNVGTNDPVFDVSEYLNSTPATELLPIMFSVTVTKDGCPKTKTFDVVKVYCDIQKGISPNNDNKNDFFDLSLLNVKNLEIFNRYGTKVYSKSNYSKEWIGQADNGNELPDGTYYYVIDLGNETKTGWIYINRERK